MDFNGDGKHDWKDHVDAYNIYQMANKENEESSFGYGSSSSSGEISPLGTIVIWLVAILCLSAIFSGAFEILPTLLGLGVIVFFIAQWLCS